MIGIKLQPWAMAHLFGQRMSELRDRVVALHEVCDSATELEAAVLAADDAAARIAVLTKWLQGLRPASSPPETVRHAVRIILDARGTVPVAEICARLSVHERSLERAFTRHIGLTPKFFSRVIRFNAIFKGVHGEHPNLSHLSMDAGYFDQPHFHRDFKAFTGENPSKYLFAQVCMANLFLNRQ